MIQVKPSSNFQEQQEKWDSSKWMGWESVSHGHWISLAFADLHVNQISRDWCAPKGASTTSSSMTPDSAQWPCQNQGLEKAKQRRSITFCAGLWLRQELETAMIRTWEEMLFWQWCSRRDPLALSPSGTTWLHGWLAGGEGYCFFCVEKYASTVFCLCGTRKGRAGEREEEGSREMENSRRAGFSLLHYANKASEHHSETELTNLILISWEGSFLQTRQYIHAL